MPKGLLQTYLNNRLLATREEEAACLDSKHPSPPEDLSSLLEAYLEDAASRASPLLSVPAQHLLEAKHPHSDELDAQIPCKPSRVGRVVGAKRAYTGPLSSRSPDMPSCGVFRWTPHGNEELTWQRYDYSDVLPMSEARARFFDRKTRDPEARQCYVLHLAAGFLLFKNGGLSDIPGVQRCARSILDLLMENTRDPCNLLGEPSRS